VQGPSLHEAQPISQGTQTLISKSFLVPRGHSSMHVFSTKNIPSEHIVQIGSLPKRLQTSQSAIGQGAQF